MAVSLHPQTNPTAALRTDSSGVASAPSKLTKAAQEFEAILLTSWLEKMNQSFVGSQESQDPAHDTVSSLGTQAIASALTARGGIGIADMLLRQLQRAHPSDANAEHTPAANQDGLAVQQSASSQKSPQQD
jgi:Rod binding domain-containing protein